MNKKVGNKIVLFALIVGAIFPFYASPIIEFLIAHQTISAALIGGLVAVWYNWQKTRLDNEVFKRELFLKYNEKYDRLNNSLEELIHQEFKIASEHEYDGNNMSLDDYWSELFEGEPTQTPSWIRVAFDYLNLCSEQCYWYKKDFIEPHVWDCWLAGMKHWHKESFFLQKIVQREKDRNAPYYNQDFLGIFLSDSKDLDT